MVRTNLPCRLEDWFEIADAGLSSVAWGLDESEIGEIEVRALAGLTGVLLFFLT